MAQDRQVLGTASETTKPVPQESGETTSIRKVDTKEIVWQANQASKEQLQIQGAMPSSSSSRPSSSRFKGLVTKGKKKTRMTIFLN